VAEFDWTAWMRPAVFEWLQSTGGVPEEDMRRTFNLGVGMILVVDPAKADEAVAMLRANGESAFKIGALKTQ
jgi:phosphoribosylformylglycinamidine cyclo-ligase